MIEPISIASAIPTGARFSKRHVTQHHAQNDHHHSQPDPVRVHVDLPDWGGLETERGFRDTLD
jgi:hypothetical protein